MNSPRIICCSVCNGEGRIYVLDHFWDPNTGGGWGDRDIGPCDACEGMGGEIIETEPVELEDLEWASS